MTQQTAGPADRLAAAKAQLDQPEPRLFTFGQAGDEIAGVIADLEWQSGEYGPRLKVTLDNGRGQRAAFFADHTTLRSKLARLRPQRGDALAVRYLGQAEGKRSTYHDYRVALATKDERAFEWSGGGGQRQQHPDPRVPAADPWAGPRPTEPTEDEPPF